MENIVRSALNKVFTIWSILGACLFLAISVRSINNNSAFIGSALADISEPLNPKSNASLNKIDNKIVRLGLKRSRVVRASKASWYGDYFDGKKTANQEIYNKNLLTAAHKTLPFNTYLLVTNMENNKQVIVRINDRGPYVRDREIDLSEGAARLLGSYTKGVINIKYEILT